MKKTVPCGAVFCVWRGDEEKRVACGRQMREEGKRNVPGCRAVIWAGRRPWRGRSEKEEHRDNSPGKLMFSRLSVS